FGFYRIASRGGAVAARHVEYKLPLRITTRAIRNVSRTGTGARRKGTRKPGVRSTPVKKTPAIQYPFSAFSQTTASTTATAPPARHGRAGRAQQAPRPRAAEEESIGLPTGRLQAADRPPPLRQAEAGRHQDHQDGHGEGQNGQQREDPLAVQQPLRQERGQVF